MGKQIQLQLDAAGEERLREFFSRRFPTSRIVDAIYPPDWDRRTLALSPDANKWLVIDTRNIETLRREANQMTSERVAGSLKDHWRLPTIARSCIQWTRNLYPAGKLPGRGRLYVNTNPAPIYADISAESGDAADTMYAAACRWIRKHATKEGTGRRTTWVLGAEV